MNEVQKKLEDAKKERDAQEKELARVAAAADAAKKSVADAKAKMEAATRESSGVEAKLNEVRTSFDGAKALAEARERVTEAHSRRAALAEAEGALRGAKERGGTEPVVKALTKIRDDAKRLAPSDAELKTLEDDEAKHEAVVTAAQKVAASKRKLDELRSQQGIAAAKKETALAAAQSALADADVALAKLAEIDAQIYELELQVAKPGATRVFSPAAPKPAAESVP